MFLEFIFHTVNGFEYKDIYANFDDSSCSHMITEVKTPNCGWKPDSVNPDCTNGCEGCIFTKNLLEIIGDI